MILSRRRFVGSLGAAVVIPADRWLAPRCDEQTSGGRPRRIYRFFDACEIRFIEAACERLIPADDSGGGALEAEVTFYLDQQLASAWGAGGGTYRRGAWQPGAPSRGHLRATPGEIFHRALGAINRSFQMRGTAFEALPPKAQEDYLRALHTRIEPLDGIPAAVFFDLLLTLTVEGFFTHPTHGGRRAILRWKLPGFAGAFASTFGSRHAFQGL
jgi:gluconate 2-dehydrogenase gamma chain